MPQRYRQAMPRCGWRSAPIPFPGLGGLHG
jgi:hypothetical protein